MVRIEPKMTLDNLMYLEDMTKDFIALYPDDVDVWIMRLVYIVEVRSANEIAGITNPIKVANNNVYQRFDAWYEELKKGWPPNDWGLEDESYYGGKDNV